MNRQIIYQSEEVGWVDTRPNQTGKSLENLFSTAILADSIILTNKTRPCFVWNLNQLKKY